MGDADLSRLDYQQWAEALLFISTFCLALALVGAWPIGLICVPASLVASLIIRRAGLAPLPAPLERGEG